MGMFGEYSGSRMFVFADITFVNLFFCHFGSNFFNGILTFLTNVTVQQTINISEN